MEFYKYQYALRNIVLTLDKNYAMSDGCVTYFFMLHDYINRRLPIVKMNIEMDITTIRKLYANKDKAKLKLDLFEYQLDSAGSVIGTNLYWQHTFTVIPAKDQTNYIASNDTRSEKVIDQMQTLQLVELFLIDMDAVKWFTQKSCGIFDKCSKASALHAIMQMRNIPGRIAIVTPPVNNDIVDHIILPLGDLIGNINTLNQGYGVYTTYPIIYYDLVNLYCIDKIAPDITMPLAKEYGNIVFIMKNMTVPDHQVTGSFNDAVNRTHFVNLTMVPEINDYTSEIGSTKFSTVTSVDSSGTVNKTTIDDNATALNYVYAHNPQTVDQVINEAMNGPTVQVTAQNIAVSFLKPYKAITFDMDTQYQNLKLDRGNIYRIEDWALSMTREGTGANARYIHDVRITLQQRQL